MATSKYGIIIKKTIPSFTASAFFMLESPASAARHIAHWAFAEIPIRKIQIPKIKLWNLEFDF